MTLAKPSPRERDPSRRVSKGGDEPFRPAFPVIASKLTAPSTRRGMVQRSRLLELLDSTDASVISVVAPPGYGKTTLLSQWASAQARPVIWLTIDSIDNDPVVLLSYLGVGFDRISPIRETTARALLGSGRKIMSSALPLLVSELHEWNQPALIVLDDAHRLTDRAALDAVSTLMDHLPPGFRIAIAARHEPALPFARISANRDLAEFGVDELALDSDETGELVREAGCDLSLEDIWVLMARTEGWAVGVYLATRALSRGGGLVGQVGSVARTATSLPTFGRSCRTASTTMTWRS